MLSKCERLDEKLKQAPNHSWLRKGSQAFPVTKHQIIPEINVLTPLFFFFKGLTPFLTVILKLEIYPANPLLILEALTGSELLLVHVERSFFRSNRV
jgi:hypothetical protein